jgi:hypothetical protein
MTTANRTPLKHVRMLALTVLGIACATHRLDAQDFSRYREFALTSDVAAIASSAGVAPAAVQTRHTRPALLQELEHRPSRWVAGSSSDSNDPVERIAFSFYNDQLFRIVVDYAPDRTEGMTSADLVDAITGVYGPPLARTARPASRITSRVEVESGTPVARWGDGQHAVVLYQTSSYRAAFRLIVTDTRLAELARAAEAQALRLDDQEAPRRETMRQQKERDDGRAAAAKARATNKGVFRP